MSSRQAQRLRGVVRVIPTPFRADESIDLEGLAACIEFAIHCDVGAVCLAAFGSEFHKLAEAERPAGLRLGPAEHHQRPPR